MPVKISKGIIIENTAPIGVPVGGVENQVLAKKSATNFDCEWVDPTILEAGYSVYTALITQTGTNDPIVTVLENTLPFTFLWERSSEGFYQGNITFVGPLPDPIPNLTNNKTLILTGSFEPSYNVNVTRYFTGEAISIDTNIAGGTVVDGAMLNFSIEVRVYP